MFEENNPREENINENEEKPSEVEENPAPLKFNNDDEFEKCVEDKRLKFRETFNKNKMVSRFTMAGVVILLLTAIILVTLNNQVTTIIGYAIAGLILVGLIVYYFINKNKFPNYSQAYIKEVTELINAYVFSDDKFSEIESHPEKKLTAVELSLDRAYKQGVEVGSRNSITGKYLDKKFEINEAAIYYQNSDGKRVTKSVGFLGKYISIENKLEFEGRYIFNLKGTNAEKLVDQPTDIEDLNVILEEDNIVVYGPSDKPVKDIFGTDFIKKLHKVDVTSPLLNAVIVVWAGHTGIYLSYDDPVTTLPFEHEFKKDAQEKFRGDLMQILDLLNK